MPQVVLLILISLIVSQCSSTKQSNSRMSGQHILVFSKTDKFRHQSIAAGKKMFLELAADNGWMADTTEKTDMFTAEGLKHYDAVVFLNTTGDVLNNEQQKAFEDYIGSGKSFVGIHAAADTEYDWPWYNKLVGGYFLSHPKPQNARYRINDHNHPVSKSLPDTINRFEEIYNYKSLQTDRIKVLIKVDESTYEGGKNGADHPFTWYHESLGGRAFYTGFGHHPETYSHEFFRDHITKAIKWALHQ